MNYYVPKHTKHNETAFKIKKFILKTITLIMGIIFVISICSLDSDKFYIPLAALVVSGGWLYLMAWANGYTY